MELFGIVLLVIRVLIFSVASFTAWEMVANSFVLFYFRHG